VDGGGPGAEAAVDRAEAFGIEPEDAGRAGAGFDARGERGQRGGELADDLGETFARDGGGAQIGDDVAGGAVAHAGANAGAARDRVDHEDLRLRASAVDDGGG
jgi:hypothetical protein